MTNIFDNQNNARPANRKKRLALWSFYGPALFLFALLLASRGLRERLCFFGLICNEAGGRMWLTALIIYLYLLLAAAVLVYVYIGLEKLVKAKRQFLFFRIILIAIPLLTALLILWIEPFWLRKHTIWVLSLSVVTMLGLLLIETRKKS